MPFEVTADLLGRARAYESAAVVALLGNFYPEVARVAQGLSGRGDVASEVIRIVMSQSLYVLPKWGQEQTPGRWFYHHTVLTARRGVRWRPGAMTDLLVVAAGEGVGAEYVAFVRALRGLPQQQVEAFLLTNGEKLEPRVVAAAMDCSVEAAGNHLIAANDALRMVVADQGMFEAMTGKVVEAYGKLEPAQALVIPEVQRQVRRFLWPRRIKRLVKWVVLGVLVYVAYRLVRGRL